MMCDDLRHLSSQPTECKERGKAIIHSRLVGIAKNLRPDQMTITRTAFLILLLSSSAHAFGADAIEAIHHTNAENFKDRALAACMSAAYKGSPASEDASITTSVFIEWTYYDDKGNAAVDKLVQKYLERDYGNPVEGYAGVQFNTLKCLDLYHSHGLEELVRKYVPHPYWIGDKPGRGK